MGSRYKPAAQTRPTLVSGRENKKQEKDDEKENNPYYRRAASFGKRWSNSGAG
jgi:hypothetical protein